MNPYYTVLLLCFLVLLAILLIRYVNNTVDKEFRGLAQAVTDPEFRHSELARVDALLSSHLPLPPDVRPLSKPGAGLRAAIAPILLALGVILLWGGGAAQREREKWFYGAVVALCVAAVIMLATLRSRKISRTARLLLFRADLKRLDNDRKGSAEDLRELLRVTPWDDSSWAELSDDLSAEGKLPEALETIREAVRIDPEYDEYRILETSLAIRLGRLDEAKAAIAGWSGITGMEEDDPRLAVYRAALRLAEGNREAAEESLKHVQLDKDGVILDFLDEDQALNDIKTLFPGRNVQ